MSDVEGYKRELAKDLGLVECILADPERFPEPPAQQEPVKIRTDAASIDLAIARAAALAIGGLECRIELTT